jgi:hypothetical protein
MTRVGVFTQPDQYFSRPCPLSGRCHAKQELLPVCCRKLLTELRVELSDPGVRLTAQLGEKNQLGFFTHPADRISSDGSAVCRG